MKKALAIGSLLGLSVLGVSSPAFAANDPAQNSPSYWAAYGDCYKVELADGVSTFTLPDLPAGERYTLLVLKAGTVHQQITSGLVEGGTYSAYSGKDLSHVIVCTKDGQYPPQYPS